MDAIAPETMQPAETGGKPPSHVEDAKCNGHAPDAGPEQDPDSEVWALL